MLLQRFIKPVASKSNIKLLFMVSSQGNLKVCVMARDCVVFGLLVEVDGFNRGNGHVKYLSNCLQHAQSATDSLLINVENSPLPAPGSNTGSILSSVVLVFV